MEAVSYFETSVLFHQTQLYNKPKGTNLDCHQHITPNYSKKFGYSYS
jgi:hypothetical protein